tara:strand:+ start:5769 stop:6080 length:312 start_codon:yes stop_codon:yes gene_type:complete
MFAFNMKRRVINILNKDKQRRTFKFLPEDEGGIIIYSDDPTSSIKYDDKEEGKIIEIAYEGGPVLSIGNTITFNERGKYKIIDIYNYLHNDSECYLLDVLKTK